MVECSCFYNFLLYKITLNLKFKKKVCVQATWYLTHTPIHPFICEACVMGISSLTFNKDLQVQVRKD